MNWIKSKTSTDTITFENEGFWSYTSRRKVVTNLQFYLWVLPICSTSKTSFVRSTEFGVRLRIEFILFDTNFSWLLCFSHFNSRCHVPVFASIVSPSVPSRLKTYTLEVPCVISNLINSITILFTHSPSHAFRMEFPSTCYSVSHMYDG